MSAVKIYTDGSALHNPGPAGIGIYFKWENRRKRISEHIGNATNNVAELMAIRTGIETLTRRDLTVKVYTDSRYCIGVLKMGWKAKANIELVNSTKSLMKNFKKIKLIKVKAHSGNPGNEIANTLARQGAKAGYNG